MVRFKKTKQISFSFFLKKMQLEDRSVNPDLRIKMSVQQMFSFLVLRLLLGHKPFSTRSRLSSSVGVNHKRLADLRGERFST